MGTKDYIKTVKINANSECLFCGLYDESAENLCKEVNQLWENIQHWIHNQLGLSLALTNLMKLLGYLAPDQNFWPLNLVLTITRKYIFWCSRNDFELNIYFLQKEVKKIYIEQETLSCINSRFDQFNYHWEFWKNLFNGIDV